MSTRDCLTNNSSSANLSQFSSEPLHSSGRAEGSSTSPLQSSSILLPHISVAGTQAGSPLPVSASPPLSLPESPVLGAASFSAASTFSSASAPASVPPSPTTGRHMPSTRSMPRGHLRQMSPSLVYPGGQRGSEQAKSWSTSTKINGSARLVGISWLVLYVSSIVRCVSKVARKDSRHHVFLSGRGRG
jgi:hypothetical protein